MTTNSISPVVEYLENGVGKTYAIPFRFESVDDLVVERIDVAAQVVKPLVRGADYSVSGAGSPNGGVLKAATAGPGGLTLRIRRFTSRRQSMAYTANDTFPAKSHENALDRQMLISQEQDVAHSDLNKRAVTVAIGDKSQVMPPRGSLAGRFLGGSAGTGDLLPLSGTGSDPAFREDAASSIGSSLIGEGKVNIAIVNRSKPLTPEMIAPNGQVGIGGDDLAIISEFFGACANDRRIGEGTPGKWYTINPNDSHLVTAAGILLPIDGPVRMRDVWLRIGANTPGYTSIIGQWNTAIDLTGCVFERMRIDQNARNTLPMSVGNKFGAGVLDHARHTVYIKRAYDFDWSDCLVENATCTNSLVYSGDGFTENCRIRRSIWRGIGAMPPGADIYHDHSTLYPTGANIEISDCGFFGSVPTTGMVDIGATCAMEPHPTDNCKVLRNVVRRYHTALNFAAISDGDATNGKIIGNDFDVLRRGIAAYSGKHNSHQSGFGIDRLTLDHNTIMLRNNQPKGKMTGGGPGMFGFSLIPGMSLPVRLIDILEGNKFLHEVETTMPDWDGLPFAIGVGETAGNTTMVEQFNIGDVLIVNAPVRAIVMGDGGGQLKNCRIGKPRIFNAGCTYKTNAQLGSFTFRTAIWCNPHSYLGSFSIDRVELSDDLPTAKMAIGVLLGGATNSQSCKVRIGYELSIAGSPTGFATAIVQDLNIVFPKIKGEQNVPFSPPNGLSVAGSRVFVTTQNISYRVPETGSTWYGDLQGNGPPAGAYPDRYTYVDNAATAGSTDRYISIGGQWKTRGAIGV
jgi:hypothetical protein